MRNSNDTSGVRKMQAGQVRQKWLDLASGNPLANLQACHKEALWGEWCLLKWTGIFSYFWWVCRDELQRRERSRKHFRWEFIGLSTFSFTSNSRVNTEYTVTLMHSWASCVIFHSSKWPFERHRSTLKAIKWLSIMRGYDHGLKCHAQVPQDTKGFQWGAQADTAWRHKWSSLCPAEPAPFIWREIDFMAIILISRKLWGAGKWSIDLTLNCQYQAWRARLSLGKAGRGRAKLKRR